MIGDRHINGLRHTLDLLSLAKSPWCIIAGSATALYTRDWSDVLDIDVIVAVDEARRLIASGTFTDHTDGGSSRYRSVVYATNDNGPMPIDICADFEVHVDGSWRPVRPTPTPIDTPAGTIYVPSLREQLEITRLLGRPKDAPRIARLEALLATSP